MTKKKCQQRQTFATCHFLLIRVTFQHPFALSWNILMLLRANTYWQNLLLCKQKFTDTLGGSDFAPVSYLVGGWTNPFEKILWVNLDHLSQIGLKIKTYLKKPPSYLETLQQKFHCHSLRTATTITIEICRQSIVSWKSQVPWDMLDEGHDDVVWCFCFHDHDIMSDDDKFECYL